MKYSQYKDEQKAFGKINGFWTWFAYMTRYKTKETFFVIDVVQFGLIAVLIADPEIAKMIREYILKLFN